jgi:hypothetical protein
MMSLGRYPFISVSSGSHPVKHSLTKKRSQATRTLLGLAFCMVSTVHAKESIDAQIQYYLDHMTIQQKLDYIHGVTPASGLPNSTGASIAAIPSLGLPEIRNTDGPNGVRSDVPSTLYPAALLLAASWDPQLAWAKGIGVGQERGGPEGSIFGSALEWTCIAYLWVVAIPSISAVKIRILAVRC